MSSSRAVVAHAFNPSTREAEAGGSLWVRGQPGLQELVPGQAPKITEKPCLKKKKKKKKKKSEAFSFFLYSSYFLINIKIDVSPQTYIIF